MPNEFSTRPNILAKSCVQPLKTSFQTAQVIEFGSSIFFGGKLVKYSLQVGHPAEGNGGITVFESSASSAAVPDNAPSAADSLPAASSFLISST